MTNINILHLPPMAKATKRKQATSKEVQCEVCGKTVFARGLSSHMRLEHKLMVKTFTRVLRTELPDSSQNQSGLKSEANDLSHLTKVQVQTYQPVTLLPGRGRKVANHPGGTVPVPIEVKHLLYPRLTHGNSPYVLFRFSTEREAMDYAIYHFTFESKQLIFEHGHAPNYYVDLLVPEKLVNDAYIKID